MASASDQMLRVGLLNQGVDGLFRHKRSAAYNPIIFGMDIQLLFPDVAHVPVLIAVSIAIAALGYLEYLILVGGIDIHEFLICMLDSTFHDQPGFFRI